MDTEIAERTKRAGVAVGLAWTPAGGDVLFIEANRMKRQRRLHHDRPDRRRDEGVHAGGADLGAVECEGAGPGRGRAEGSDLHIHVPAGAIPKDGPSAGVTMATALV